MVDVEDFGVVGADRLLAEDGLAGQGGGLGDFHVNVGGCGDEHGLDLRVGEHLTVVGGELLGRRELLWIGVVGLEIADPVDDDIRHSGDVQVVHETDAAQADMDGVHAFLLWNFRYSLVAGFHEMNRFCSLTSSKLIQINRIFEVNPN